VSTSHTRGHCNSTPGWSFCRTLNLSSANKTTNQSLSVVVLQSCDNFEWFQPQAAVVTCNVWDVEADIWMYKIIQLLGQLGKWVTRYTGITRNCGGVYILGLAFVLFSRLTHSRLSKSIASDKSCISHSGWDRDSFTGQQPWLVWTGSVTNVTSGHFGGHFGSPQIRSSTPPIGGFKYYATRNIIVWANFWHVFYSVSL